MERTIIFLIFFVGYCSSAIIVKTAEPTKSFEVIDAAIHIVTSCYEDRGTIGIVGDVPKRLVTKMWSTKPIPVMLFENNTRMTDYGVKFVPPTKLRVFLLIGLKAADAILNFQTILNSGWFNPSAFVLVLFSWQDRSNGCSFVSNLMKWYRSLHVMNINVLCLPAGESVSIYGYNPHTNKAPEPWQLVHNYEEGGSSLFHRSYESDDRVCWNLNYDVSDDHGGKPLYLVDINGTISNSAYDRLSMRTGRDILTFMNVWNVYVGKVNARMIIHTQKLVARKSFMYLKWALFIYPVDLQYLGTLGYNIDIYPFMQAGYTIVSRFRGHKSQLEKIIGIIDEYSRFGVCLTLLVSLIFFKIVAGQRLIPGILNVVRMICNTGFTNLPDDLPTRTYLACLFVFIVTMQGIFSGDLASLLTTAIPVRHPRTIQDLVDMNYTIYVSKILEKAFEDLKGKVDIKPGVMNDDFMEHRQMDIAWIYRRHAILDLCTDPDFYVNENDIMVNYVTIFGSSLFNFADRLSTMILRMSEARILQPLQVRVKETRQNEYQSYLRELDPGPQVIKFDDVAFAFVLLGVGLACSIICFFVEISIKPVRSKFRRYFRHSSRERKPKIIRRGCFIGQKRVIRDKRIFVRSQKAKSVVQ